MSFVIKGNKALGQKLKQVLFWSIKEENG